MKKRFEEYILKRFSKKHRKELVILIRDVIRAPDEEKAQKRLQELLDNVCKIKQNFVDYADERMSDGFAVFALPEKRRKRLRTTNMVERVNQEVKRRTRVIRIFPSKDFCEKCAGTVFVHIDASWRGSNYCYLDREELKEVLGKDEAPPWIRRRSRKNVL